MSLQAKALELVLRAQRLRGPRRTPDRLARDFADGVLRPRSFTPPKDLDDVVDISVSLVDGQRLYLLRPLEDAAPVTPPHPAHILLLHGGGYVGEVGERHWRLGAELVIRLGATVSIPIYPLAPLESAADGVPRSARLLEWLTTANGAVHVVGDSAGAGLALATLLLAAGTGGRLPARVVLISPWLDAATDHPQVTAAAPRDPMLDVESLRLGGLAWAGDLPVTDPLVSPLNGDLSTLAGVSFLVQSGTSDLLNHDARRFREAAGAAGVEVRYVERPDLLHAYPIFPMPEGRRARDEIVAFLS